MSSALTTFILGSWRCLAIASASMVVAVAPLYSSCAVSADIADAEQVECVVEHVDAYLAVPKDPILVWLDLCPIVSPSAEQVAALARNTLPKIPTPTTQRGAKRVLVLRRSELECLRERAQEVVRELGANSNNELVELDLSVCR